MSLILKNLKPVILLLGGLLFVIAAPFLKSVAPQWATLFALFLVANIALAINLNLTPRLKSTWSVKKIIHFPIGVLIGVMPALAVLATSGASPNWSGIAISSSSILITLIIVAWEELWFRGIALEFASIKYSKIGAACVFAVIFCLIHVFNPNLDLISAAPDLVLGSYALAMSYFVFDSIWAPIGMHFGNNLLEGSLQQLDYFPLHSSPGVYLSVSALISIAFTIVLSKQRSL